MISATSARSLSLIFVLTERSLLAEARAHAESLVEEVRARRHRFDEGRSRWALSEVRRRQGDLDGALADARAALDLLADVPLDRTAVAATFAAVLLAQGRAAEARAASEDAIRKYAEVRGCAFFRGGFLRLVHAECLWATGDKDAGRAAIAAAERALLTNADKIGDPVYRQRFLADVPENTRTLALAREWLGGER